MDKSNINKPYVFISYLVFSFFFLWWILLQTLFKGNLDLHNNFSDSYGILAGLGGFYGLIVARKWGGFRSYMGKSINFFSLGLIAQFFGQIVYTVYFYVFHVDIPYPSLGDLGYAGSIPLYILGIWYLGKVSGGSINYKVIKNKPRLVAIATVLPLIMLAISYTIFLSNYEFDWTVPVTIFLDFFYPFGQAIYISLALTILFLSSDLLGGLIKNNILLIIFALMIQFSADFLFLYKSNREIWEAGGLSDFLYLLAYFLMILSLIKLNDLFDRMKNNNI